MMFLFCSFLLAASLASALSPHPNTIYLPPQYSNTTPSIEHLSTPGNLDGFKMLVPAARASADFWYFDVVSASTNQTLNIVFFNSGEFAQYPHPLAVQISGTFSNGSDFYRKAMADEGVLITNGPSGVRGEWHGVGSFEGTPLDRPDVKYTIRIGSPAMGVQGTVIFDSVSNTLHCVQPYNTDDDCKIAPAHYPCAMQNVSGASQVLLPSLYWSNAIPDAHTTANLTLSGETIAFSDGIGYHDKNWGNKSIISVPKYWDWGHGRLGPYSIVWYDLLSYNGTESRRSYVYNYTSESIVLLSCDESALVVRQKGGKAAWPPTTGLLETEGITIEYNLEDGRKLAVDVTTELIVRDEKSAYQRANGKLKGGVVGEECYEGKGHMEEFIYGVVN